MGCKKREGKHHCPVCNESAKTRCVKKQHLAICGGCKKAFSVKHNRRCPFCLGKDTKEEKRHAKEDTIQEEEEEEEEEEE
ncbi:hypothetical protein FOQG_01174 [Fusarium oxysporum f. sp. raphani 54005]|nr:hypothetical protein FOQG_01174 [Fusarium oxysporum f. sp. raphani 54005]